MKWLTNIWKRANGERRKAPRHAIPMVAYYWNGGCAIPHAVQNISRHGAFVRTGVTWGLGTSLLLHLREDEAAWLLHASASSISVMATVVRHTTEGMGLRLLFTNPKERRAFDDYLAALAGRHKVRTMLLRRNSEDGHSLVEFALLLPLLFLLIVNAVNFGSFFFAWITVANAARSAGQYAVMASATVTTPRPATSAQISAVVTQDISSLLNRSSLAVRVCTNNAGTVACTTTGTGTFTDPPADSRPEANLFVMAWVDVLYTYRPLIPLFNFPRLGIRATLPATRIHRQTVMRMLQ